MNRERLRYLLEKWMERTITPAEEDELNYYLEEHWDGGDVPELLEQFILQISPGSIPSLEVRQKWLSRILEIDRTMDNMTNGSKSICPMKHPNNHPFRVSFRRWGWVAASILLLLAEGAVVMLAVTAHKREQHIIATNIPSGPQIAPHFHQGVLPASLYPYLISKENICCRSSRPAVAGTAAITP